MASRRGKFGTGTAPFGGGAPLSDLSVYNIGGSAAAVPGNYSYAPSNAPPADYGAGWSTTYGDNGEVTYTPPPAPERPTVAPAVGMLPEPVIPTVVSPYVQLLAEWEGITQRALASGNTPTSTGVAATQFKYPSAAVQAELDAIEARAIAAGKTPSESDIQATYLKNLAAAAGG